MKKAYRLVCIASLGGAAAWSLPVSVRAQDAAAPAKEEAPAAEAEADVTIEMTGNDLMTYNKAAFTVKPGQKVKLVFKNIGQLPKVAMGHNVVILQQGQKVEDFAAACLKFPPEYFPKDEALEKKVLAHTKLLGPGETDTIIFTAPKAGNYAYLCTFPAHFAKMRGIMTVKE